MFGLGLTEIIALLAVALIFIGPKKLPELAKTLGRGLKEFQNAAKGLTQDIRGEGPQQRDDKSSRQDSGDSDDRVIDITTEKESDSETPKS